ncbi:MAG: S41 family peptidase [Chthonomonadales bacterium]
MKRRFARCIGILLLVALPMFVGFAGPDISSGRWDRAAHNTGGMLRELFILPAAAARDENTIPFEAYKQALDVLKKDYYGARIDAKKTRDLTYAAIRGMLYTLNDPFTSFLDPDEWTQMQQTTRGDFEGIGAVLEPYGQDVRVVRPIEGSPAYRAGLKPHDVIYSVTNYDQGSKKTTVVLGKNINDVVKLIKGPQGTRVDVAVIRKGRSTPITFHLIRAHIEPPTVRYWMEDPVNKIGRILLNEFNEKSDAQFDKAYQALMAKGMRGLIFDLRYNPGGLLNVAIDIGSRFIDSGPVVIIQEKNGQRQAYGARVRKHHVNVPVVVLINESSASASEIVAGAIKDNKAGILVGTHTFGKGLVQTLFPLSDGSALRLTTAKYFTPKGNDISNKYDEEHRPIFGTGGIKPDIAVTQPDTFTSLDWAEENKKNDAQLKKAIEVLRTRLAQNPGRASE